MYETYNSFIYLNEYLFTVMFLLLCSKIYCFISLKNGKQFLRHLLGITKLDKENNQCIRQKTGVQNTEKEIEQYQEKRLQHVQRMNTKTTKTSTTLSTKRTKEHRTTEEEMEGPT